MSNSYKSGQILTECGKPFTFYSFGNQNAQPVLFFHGGPGSGFNFDYISLITNLLNDAHFITFDQRQCGRSLGFNFPDENNTSLLLQDAESLRHHFGLDRWTVSGHSWGATLSLLYAQKFPDHCDQLFLSSTFLGRRKDQDWTFNGARTKLPDIFDWTEHQLDMIFPPIAERASLERRLINGLRSEDLSVRRKTAYIFNYLSQYLARQSPIAPSLEAITNENVRSATVSLSYAEKDFFIDPNIGAIIDLDILSKIPMTLLHGEYDIDCPVGEIKNLVKRLSHANLIIVPGAHSMFEEPMKLAINQALGKLVTQPSLPIFNFGPKLG